MLHWVKEENSAANIVTIYGSSDDTKPSTGISGGSVFIETDTHKIFMYDEKTGQWKEF